MKQFSVYTLIGVLNTALHWGVFYALLLGAGWSQSLSNLVAFIVAVTFSFFMNAKLTFRASTHTLKYLHFVAFMGLVSWSVGYAGDAFRLPSLLTLVVFSALSLVLGFCYSKFVVFKEKP